jgi:hypothetical protein
MNNADCQMRLKMFERNKASAFAKETLSAIFWIGFLAVIAYGYIAG